MEEQQQKKWKKKQNNETEVRAEKIKEVGEHRDVERRTGGGVGLLGCRDGCCNLSVSQG